MTAQQRIHVLTLLLADAERGRELYQTVATELGNADEWSDEPALSLKHKARRKAHLAVLDSTEMIEALRSLMHLEAGK